MRESRKIEKQSENRKQTCAKPKKKRKGKEKKISDKSKKERKNYSNLKWCRGKKGAFESASGVFARQ